MYSKNRDADRSDQNVCCCIKDAYLHNGSDIKCVVCLISHLPMKYVDRLNAKFITIKIYKILKS